MGGKKGDTKQVAKKGGGKEPEKKKPAEAKGKDEGKKGKDDPKGAKGDKGAKNEPKGGKGKGKEDKKKGKDAKKGKKATASDSEAGSDTELIKDSGEESEKGAEEDEDSQEDAKKAKRVAALKGASKAMAGMKERGRGRKIQSEEEEEEEAESPRRKKDLKLKGTSQLLMGLGVDENKRKEVKKEHARAQLKGATKAMAGLAKKPMPPPKSKRSLKSTSRLFMKFRGMGPSRHSKKGHFKTASKLFLGLKNKIGVPSLLAKKKKSAAVLKNTSKLMMGLQRSKKKKEEVAKSASAGGDSDTPAKKPTFMLVRLGGKTSEKVEGGKKGVGKLFGGFFGRKKAKDKFKPKAKLLSKVSSAANWMTRKFLSRRTRYPQDESEMHAAGLSRMGGKKMPFPSEDEVRWHRANMNKFPGRQRYFDYVENGHGHPPRFQNESYQGMARGRYFQQPPGRYPPRAPQAYYDPYQEQEDYGYPPPENDGYYNDEEDYYEPQYGYNRPGPYGDGMEDYGGYPGYQNEDAYDENMDFYNDGNYPSQSQYTNYDEEYDEEQYNEPYDHSPYEDYGDEMDYYEDQMETQGYYDNQYEDYDPSHGEYDPGEEEMDYYGDANPQHQINYGEHGLSPYGESSYNPYAYPMDDIMEVEEAEQADEQYGNYSRSQNTFFEQQGMKENVPSTLSLNRKYRLFPRPQVKMFGREKLDISLPPSPHISFTDYDEEEDEYEDQPLLSPTDQYNNPKQKSPRTPFEKLVRGKLGPSQGPPQGSRLQRSPSPNLTRRRFDGGAQYEEFEDFSPREFGSPLGQFMKESLTSQPVLQPHAYEMSGRPTSPAPARRSMAQFGGGGPARPSSPHPSVKHFQMPSPSIGFQNPPSSPQPRRQYGSPERKSFYHPSPQPSVRRFEAFQDESDEELPAGQPAYKRFGHKLTGMDTSCSAFSNSFREFDHPSSNNNSQRLPSPQPSRRSMPPSPQPVRRMGSIRGNELPMPPSPNLSTRQMPLSPKPNRAFKNPQADSHSRFGNPVTERPPPPSPRGSFRQRAPPSPQPSLRRAGAPMANDHSSSSPPFWGPSSPISETPQPSKRNIIPPNRPGHPTDRNSHYQSTSTQAMVHEWSPPPSPQPVLRRGNSIRNEPPLRSPSPQPSIRCNAPTSKFQMSGLKSKEAAAVSPPGSPVSQRLSHSMSGGMRMPPSPQPSMRRFGAPASPYPTARNVENRGPPSPQPSRKMSHPLHEAQGRLPQAWNRNSEPPTEAVKPLIRNQFMKHLGRPGSPPPFKPSSPRPSLRGMPPPRNMDMPPSPQMLRRQGSRRVSIRESPHFLSESAPFPNDTASPMGRSSPQFRRRHEMQTQEPPSPQMERSRSIRGISKLPPPPNPAPELRKPFLKHIGQPLAGMAYTPPPTRQSIKREGLPTETNTTFPEKPAKNTFLRQSDQPTGGQTQRPASPNLSIREQAKYGGLKDSPSPQSRRRPFGGRAPSSPQPSLKQAAFSGGESRPRSPSPKSARPSFGGTVPPPVHSSPPSILKGNANLSPQFQRAPLKISQPMMPGPSFSPPRSPSSRERHMRPVSPKFHAEQYYQETEDGTGRYAVVMPQVQKMGSFRGPSSMNKQPWSKHHTVNVHEMHGTWSSQKSLHTPSAENFNRGPPRRKETAGGYLAHGKRRPGNEWEDNIQTDKLPWHNKAGAVEVKSMTPDQGAPTHRC